MVMTLIGCSEKKAPEDPNAKYYGRYETIRLESMDDRFTQDIMDVVLEQMQQEKTPRSKEKIKKNKSVIINSLFSVFEVFSLIICSTSLKYVYGILFNIL